MSKLKFIFASLFSIMLLAGFGNIIPNSNETHHEHKSESSQEGQDIWGKSRGPILVKIEALYRENSLIELKGLIKSNKENLSTEWKIPEGAILVSGNLENSIRQIPNSQIAEVTIVLDMSAAKSEPIIFTAYTLQNNERLGHSRAFKWNKTQPEIEHVEKIQLKMKDRKSKFVR